MNCISSERLKTYKTDTTRVIACSFLHDPFYSYRRETMFSTDTMMALSALSIIRLMSRERFQDIAMLAVKNRNETECGFWSLRLK